MIFWKQSCTVAESLRISKVEEFCAQLRDSIVCAALAICSASLSFSSSPLGSSVARANSRFDPNAHASDKPTEALISWMTTLMIIQVMGKKLNIPGNGLDLSKARTAGEYITVTNN